MASERDRQTRHTIGEYFFGAASFTGMSILSGVETVHLIARKASAVEVQLSSALPALCGGAAVYFALRGLATGFELAVGQNEDGSGADVIDDTVPVERDDTEQATDVLEPETETTS